MLAAFQDHTLQTLAIDQQISDLLLETDLAAGDSRPPECALKDKAA